MNSAARPLRRDATIGHLRLALLGAAITSAGAGVVVGMVGPAWALSAVAVVVLAWLAYAGPGVLFAAYLCIPFYKGALQPYSPVDLTVLLAMLNAAQLAVLWSRRPTAIRPAAVAGWVTLTALVVLGVAYAPNPDASLSVSIEWVLLVFLPMGAVIRIAPERRYVNQFVLALLGYGVAVSLAGLLTSPGEMGPRLAVLEANAINVAMAALLVPVIAVAYLGVDGAGRRRLVSIAVSPIAVFVALASGSRGPVVMAAVVIVPTLLWTLTRGRSMRRPNAAVFGAVAAGFVAVLLAAATALPTGSLSRFGSLVAYLADQNGGNDTSAVARQSLFEIAWRMFEARPILGWGTGSFNSQAQFTPALEQAAYPHNLPLEFAASYGFVGLVVFGFLVIAAARGGLPSDPDWRAVGLVLVFWLLETLVSGGLYEERMLWGLLLLVSLRPMTTSLDGGHPSDVPATSSMSPFGASDTASSRISLSRVPVRMQ